MDRAVLVQNFSAVTGACLLVRKPAYLEVGGLDETLAAAFNDVDFCLRLQERGYRNLWVPYAELIHHESASRGTGGSLQQLMQFMEETTIMEKRWATMLRDDPAYNCNLASDRTDFSLAWPPRCRATGKTIP